MSMAHSLEVRCPLLDHRLVELAFRIPAARKQQGQGKALLRALARRRLPGALWQLPKKGFNAPIGPWLAGQYAGMFADEVLGSRSEVSTLLDRADLTRRAADHSAGRRDHGYTLWAAWVLERWLKSTSRRA